MTEQKINYSIIMSVYEKVEVRYLKESIDSILNQTYKTNQFIIIKDGRLTKEQNELIYKYKNNNNIISIIEFKENRGAGIAYNEAMKVCINEFAAIMDSDDYADKTKFEKQIEYLKKHPEIDVIGTNAVEFIDRKDNIKSYRYMPEMDKDIKKFAHGRCPIIQPTAIFRVKAVIDSGGYRDSPLTEDYDLYIRMIQKGYNFYTYQEVLYFIRTSDEFFKRRGGIKYLKPILSFKYKYFKSGFFTFPQFIKTFLSSFIVALLPNFLRSMIYKKFLRN